MGYPDPAFVVHLVLGVLLVVVPVWVAVTR